MRDSFSFKTTLLFSFWILLLLALLLPSWFYYRSITKALMTEAENEAVLQIHLVHWLYDQEEGLYDIEHLQDWLISLSKQTNSRLTYVAESGRVEADSDFPLTAVAEMESFSNRPEIIQAQTEGLGVIIRYSRIVDEEFIYTAKKVQQKGSIPPGFLRIAVPFFSVKEVLNQLKEAFLIFVLIVFSATALVSYRLFRRLRSPLHALIDATQAIGNKDFKRRVRFSPDQELYPLGQSVNHMAESLDRQFVSISEERQRLDAVFNGMQEGVMVLDSQGRVVSINRALSEMVNNPSRFQGRRPLELAMNLELQSACDEILSSPSSAGPCAINLQIDLREGKSYDVTIVKLQEQQRDMGAIVVFHDISELKRLERVRQDFVANVSHELRTPLTSIKGYTETLLSAEEPEPATLSSFLQIILKNTNHMVSMVDDLLSLARLEARHTTLKPSSVNALDALMAAWKGCSSMAEDKIITLENKLPEKGVTVSADFDQLVRVFRNLMENAIRHSPPGASLTVSCDLEGETVRFSVRDEGPGIPKPYQQRVFERFFRIEKHRGNESGSTGLGLAICRHIIKNHGGKIWVQSPNPGGLNGSTFFFTLPGSAMADKNA